MIFLTALLTGLMGSFHCAGMCGPLAFATPTLGSSPTAKWWSKITYHGGRIFTYFCLGILFGSLGYGIHWAGFQQGISIGTGIIMIIIGIFSSKWLENRIGNIWSPLKTKAFQTWNHQKSWRGLFILGLLQGLLPCGLVYFALIASIATQSPLEGGIFMAFFGLGTLPMMLSISLLGNWMEKSRRILLSKLIPLFSVMVGCLFVLRGMSLGIPMLSPKISQSNQKAAIECCSKTTTSPNNSADGCCGNSLEKCTCNHKK